MKFIRNIPDLKFSHTFIRGLKLANLHNVIAENLNFFALPEPDKKTLINLAHNESGYRQIDNKEIYMLREADSNFPASSQLAQECHQICKQLLVEIAERLQLDPETLLQLIESEAFPVDGISHSVLRINHYKAADSASNPILSPAHEDLGLLTLVLKTNTPALEIYDYTGPGKWLDIENEQTEQDILVMVGESLSFITNRFYLPATHRVRNPNEDRLSIVYHLRLNNHAVLNSKQLENPISGKFKQDFQITGAEFMQSEIDIRQSVNKSY